MISQGWQRQASNLNWKTVDLFFCASTATNKKPDFWNALLTIDLNSVTVLF